MVSAKRILILSIFAFCINIALIEYHVAAHSESVRLVINSHTTADLPTAPVFDRGQVLVPARAVFESLGATVIWHEDSQTMLVQYRENDVLLRIGDNNIVVNNYPIEIPVPARMIDGHTMIPVVAVSTNLGFRVDFRDMTVFVDSSDYMRPPIINDGVFTRLTYAPGPIITDDNSVNTTEPATPNEQPPIIMTPPATLPGTQLGVHYDRGQNILFIPRTSGVSLMSLATQHNLYHEMRYRIALNVDASQLLSPNNIPVNTPILDSFDIVQSASGTELIFNAKQIIAIHIGENDTHYMIHVMCPRQRYRRIVIIDPGHGGERPGAVYDDIRAADLNLAVTQKLVSLIEANGHVRAFTTRNADTTVPWSDRYGMANAIGDMMITIHHNAAYNLDIHGTESFYVTDEHDNGRALTNRRLAELVQRNVVAQTGRHSRGIRSENFFVLQYSTVPSTLVEIGFMSNQAEFATLTNTEYQWRAARGIYQAILEAFAYVPHR